MRLAPALHLLPPEAAHRLTLRLLKAGRACGLLGRPTADDPILASRLWGLDFPNPVGLAAGFDKLAEVPDALLGLGFGFTEVGTVTPWAQIGNPPPRVFRLPEDGAVINRLGFNSDGLAAMRQRLAARERRGIVGANIGRNKDSVEAVADYVAGAAAMAPLVDYVVINVSSPNTAGLRTLQQRQPIADLIQAVAAARDRTGRRPPILVKIAPDLGPEELRDVAEVALETGIEGLIVANTTLLRPPTLASRHRSESGGLSGRPLRETSTAMLAQIYRLTRGRLALVGVGGVESGADAYAKIRAGASLVQLYTALIFEGPRLITRIKRDLAALLRRDGFRNLSAAVGADVPLSS